MTVPRARSAAGRPSWHGSPPPVAMTSPLLGASSPTTSSSRRRKWASPFSAKISGIERPSVAVIRSSVSTKQRPSRRARMRPTEDFPPPMKPTSTTLSAVPAIIEDRLSLSLLPGLDVQRPKDLPGAGQERDGDQRPDDPGQLGANQDRDQDGQRMQARRSADELGNEELGLEEIGSPEHQRGPEGERRRNIQSGEDAQHGGGRRAEERHDIEPSRQPPDEQPVRDPEEGESDGDHGAHREADHELAPD